MTHDELIAKLDDFNVALSNGFGNVKVVIGSVNAVRAAVELHYEHTSGSGDVYCYNCQQLYPCLTIQAIEKELK